METVMDEKFHSYIEKTLSGKPMPEIKDHSYNHNKIYILIDNCKDLLDMGKPKEAKQLYNKIRKTFMDLNLKGTEQIIIKETIKDLYKKISLSSVK